MYYFKNKSLELIAIYWLIHLGITATYGSFVKWPYDCQPLQFYGHNFTTVRASNKGSSVDRVTKLHTLAVTQRLFCGAKKPPQNCLPWQLHGHYLAQREFCWPTNHIEQFHGHSENAKKALYAVTLKLPHVKILLVRQILAEPKSVCVTAKVSSVECLFIGPPKSLCITAKVCSYVTLYTEVLWLDLLPVVKFWP